MWVTEDHIVLQRDLEVLSNWSSVQFNVSKCFILTITKKHNPSLFQYIYHPWTDIGESRAGWLPRCYNFKRSSMGVSLQQNHAESKSHSWAPTLHLIFMYTGCQGQSLPGPRVRPQLVYASESWNPYNTNTVNRLEQVQRAAARFVYRDYQTENYCNITDQHLGLGFTLF